MTIPRRSIAHAASGARVTAAGIAPQRELVRRTGLSASAVADLYHDRSTRVDLATLDKVCAALDVRVGALLAYRADPREP